MASSLTKVAMAWDSAGLLTKAQRYVEEMLAQDRSDWRFAFWSSLTLEVLARAALAHISPVLLADPDDWNNLYYALGKLPTAPRFTPKSIAISKVLERLQSLIPEFDEELKKSCLVHTAKRNAELHSNECPFDNAKSSAWLPLFYRSCSVLLASMDKQLSDLLGVDEAAVAKAMIDAANDKTAEAVKGMIEAHKKVWLAKEDDDRLSLAATAASWARPQAGHVVDCPACASKALLIGDPIKAPMKTINEHTITEKQATLPRKFECIACGMKISGLSHLSAAGLGDLYNRTVTYDAAEYYAPSYDDDPDEDNNDPY